MIQSARRGIVNLSLHVRLAKVLTEPTDGATRRPMEGAEPASPRSSATKLVRLPLNALPSVDQISAVCQPMRIAAGILAISTEEWRRIRPGRAGRRPPSIPTAPTSTNQDRQQQKLDETNYEWNRQLALLGH
jgi:hypothetical protein